MPSVANLRPFARILCSLALVLLLATCVESAPAGPLVQLVDSRAVAAIVVESPYKLFQAADGFWNAAGLATLLGSDLGSYLLKNVPDGATAQDSLDFARPWTISFVPVAPDSKATRTVICLPYRGQPNAFLAKLGSQGDMKLVKQAFGYAVFATGEGDLEFPPSHPADLSRLSAYPAGSIKAWASPSDLRRLTADDWKPMAAAAHRFVGGESESPGAALGVFEEMALSLLAQVKSADAALVPGSSGLSIRVGASLVAGSQAEKLLAAAAGSPSALDWVPQVRSDALYGFAWSMDPNSAGQLSTAMMAPLLATLGLDSAAVAHLTALQTRWAGAAGPRGAASFDMSIDATKLGGLKSQTGSSDPGALSQAMASAMKLKLELVQEVRDPTRYLTLMRGLGTDPDLMAFMDAYRDKLGLGIALRNEQLSDGSFPYGNLHFQFSVADPAKLSSLGEESASSQAATAAMLDAMGRILSLRWSVADGRLSATTDDLAALKLLGKRQSAQPGLAGVAGFSSFARGLPGTVLSVGYLSAARLSQLVQELVAASPSGASGFPLDPGRLGLWYGYLSALPAGPGAGAGLETGFFIPASDIKYLIELVASMKKPDASTAQ
ncbi:MAG TPA: hypothetical protein VMC79_10020 [Rectinemataceae bacterium]|nr:hypothetical protein [Rectinemataceae bacterium]